MSHRVRIIGGFGALILLGSTLASCTDNGPTEVKGEQVTRTTANSTASAIEQTTITTIPTTTTTTAPTTTTTAAPEPQLQIQSGFTAKKNSIGTQYVTVGVLLTNPSKTKAAYDISVLFNLKVADGSVIDTTSERLAYIAPGKTVPVAPLQIGFDKPAPSSLEVFADATFAPDAGREGARGFYSGEGVDLNVVSAVIRPGSYDPQLTGQVRNPSDKTVKFASWNCVFLFRGKILGGQSSGIVDPIPPGVTVAFSYGLSVQLAADQVVCRAEG